MRAPTYSRVAAATAPARRSLAISASLKISMLTRRYLTHARPGVQYRFGIDPWPTPFSASRHHELESDPLFRRRCRRRPREPRCQALEHLAAPAEPAHPHVGRG